MRSLKAAVRQTAAFLDRWHWVLLALVAPLLLFPSPGRSPALLIVPAMWIVAWVAGREPLPRTPLNGTLLLLNLMVLVSAYATYDIAISLPKVSGAVLAIGVFYAIAREGQRPGGWWLSLLAFLGMGLGVAGLGLLGTRWIAKVSFLTPITSRLPARLTGLIGAEEGFHPNEVAGALLWVMPAFITLSVLLVAKTKDLWIAFGRGRTTVVVSLMVVITIFITGVFVLTQSRGGHIAFALTGLTLLSMALPPRGRWLFLGSLTILMVVAGVVLPQQEAATIWGGLIGSDLADDPAFSLNTLQGRLEVWSRAIYGIQDFPFTGMGMNTFRHVVHVLYPLFLISPDADIAHAHNEFLQATLDLGIPGLIAFLALHVGAFWMLGEIWQAVPINKSQIPNPNPLPPPPLDSLPLIQTLVLGLGGGLFAHMLYGLTDAVALGAKPGILFWMLLGLISGLFVQVRSGRLPLLRYGWLSGERGAGHESAHTARSRIQQGSHDQLG
jgi:putative inorganic carbon (HCO3(-)) transporter